MEYSPIRSFIREAFRLGSKPARTVDFVVVPVLTLLILLLPPVSITSRFSNTETPKLATASSNVKVELLSGNLPAGTQVKATTSSGALPTFDSGLSAVSPLYRFDAPPGLASKVKFTLPLETQATVGEYLDIYSLTDAGWQWQTSTGPVSDENVVTVETENLPDNLVVVRTTISNPSILASLPRNNIVDTSTKGVLAVLNPIGHYVKSDGSLAGPLGNLPGGNFSVIPSIRNTTGDDYDGKILDGVLASDQSRKDHLGKIVALVIQSKYGGIDIDYQGLDPKLSSQFAAFASELAEELHKSDLKLSVTVPSPTNNDSGWNSGAYDLSALGKAADILRVRPAMNRSAYYNEMPSSLAYVTSKIDRRKVYLVLSTQSVEYSPTQAETVEYKDSLKPAAKVDIKQPATIAQGKTLTFIASNLLPDAGATGIKWDDPAKSVSYSFAGSDGPHTVYIENVFSTAARLQLARQSNLRGVSLEPIGDYIVDSKISELLKPFTSEGKVEALEPNSSEFLPLWSGSEGAVEIPTGSWTNWTIPNSFGDYSVSVSVGDGVTRVSNPKPISISDPNAVVAAKPTPTQQPQAAVPTPAKAAPTPPPAVVSAPAPTTGTYPGVGYGMCVDPGNNLAGALRLLRQAGFGWAKVQLRWESLESSKGNINWGMIDDVVNQTNANGVRLLVSVVTAPSWSRPGDTDWSVPGPPADPQDYANFVGALARRYPGKIHAYEIWNEQNLWYEWGGHGRKLSATQYVNLLKVAYGAIKAADPSAVVLSGALTPTGLNDGDTAYDDVQFLQMMYDAGVKNYSDAIAAHPSGFNNAPDDDPSKKTVNSTNFKGHWSFYYRRFEQFRDVMVRNGDGNKQIWFTEFGWASSSSPYPEYAYAKEVSEEDQATWLARAFEIARAKGYVGVMALWNLNYASSAEADDRYAKKAFSVLNPDWTARPAYNRLAAMPK